MDDIAPLILEFLDGRDYATDVLGDWLEERGDPAFEAVRAFGRCPIDEECRLDLALLLLDAAQQMPLALDYARHVAPLWIARLPEDTRLPELLSTTSQWLGAAATLEELQLCQQGVMQAIVVARTLGWFPQVHVAVAALRVGLPLATPLVRDFVTLGIQAPNASARLASHVAEEARAAIRAQASLEARRRGLHSREEVDAATTAAHRRERAWQSHQLRNRLLRAAGGSAAELRSVVSATS